MTYCIGIDPGVSGAIALVDRRGAASAWPMPVNKIMVARTKRRRIDVARLVELLRNLANLADLAVIEATQPRPKDSPITAFNMGFASGVCYAATLAAGIRTEAVSPSHWKRVMKVPGKDGKADVDAIMKRACDLFPASASQFYGPKGGKLHDLAEAALLAQYGLDYVLPQPTLGVNAQGILTRPGE